MPSYKSLKSGKYVSEYYAKRHPRTTVEIEDKGSDPNLVQVFNPRSKTYTVVSRSRGEIVEHVDEPLEGVRVV